MVSLEELIKIISIQKRDLHFNKDGAKGKNSSEGYDDWRFHKPFLFGNGAWDSVDTAWIVRLARQVPA